MSDGIYHNQEVTLEDLNNIARDLGNTSFNGFGENKFGAAELNKITASLVTAGVLMEGDNCQPSYSDGTITIASGTVVFESGARKTLTEPVSLTADAGSWVYILNNIAAGTCSAVVSDTEPTAATGDYVSIASVSALGALTDRRVFSSAKVNMPTGNQTATKTVTNALFGTTAQVAINMGFSGFRYILYTTGSSNAQGKPSYEGYDISDGEEYMIRSSNGIGGSIYVRKNGSELNFRKDGQVHINLTFTVV